MSKITSAKIIDKSIFTFLVFIVYTGAGFGQSDLKVSDRESSKVAAKEIIERAKKAIGRSIKVEDVKSIGLEIRAARLISEGGREKRQTNLETKLFVALPNQMMLEVFSDFTSNQHLKKETLNADRYSETSSILVNGSPINPVLNLPAVTKEQQIASLRQRIFTSIFPVVLQSSWYQDLEFKFVGEAESKDGKADVIEATDKNNTKFRLFFDKENHYPVMMTEKIFNPKTNKGFERNYYFSDYREAGGLMVAHKIVVQVLDMMTEERQITKFQVNPAFKSNLFEVKENYRTKCLK